MCHVTFLPMHTPSAAERDDPAATVPACAALREQVDAQQFRLLTLRAEHQAACAQRISELDDALSAAREKSNADEARLDQLFASAAADKKRLAELEKATSSKAADIF